MIDAAAEHGTTSAIAGRTAAAEGKAVFGYCVECGSWDAHRLVCVSCGCDFRAPGEQGRDSATIAAF